MPEYVARHRRQGDEGAWAARYGCTAIAFLVAMDQTTRGQVGPGIDVDVFRRAQPDQEGGIDLHDGRIAAAHFGVAFTVAAAYGGTVAATLDSLRVLGSPDFDAALVIQGDHDRLPSSLRCAGFLGDHAVMSRGWRIQDGAIVWDVSNPLCPGWSVWPDPVMVAYTAKLAGDGRAWIAASPRPMEEPAVLPVTDRTPRIVSLAKGDQLYTLAGAPKIKVSVGGDVMSPFGASGGRIVIVTTGGVLQAVLARPAEAAIHPIADPDDAVLAQIRDLAAGAIDE